MKALEILMDEHRLIERGLAVARCLAERLLAGEEVPVEDVQALAGFLREYADRHHHAKEEDLLFPWMAAQGFPQDAGPLACMLHEHVAGRELVGQVAEGATRLPESAPQVALALRQLANLLAAHILKEDEILYPMAARLGDGDAELLPAYEAACPEASRVEAESRRLIEELEASYGLSPPPRRRATQAV